MKKIRTTGVRRPGQESQTSNMGAMLLKGVLAALVFTAASILVFAFLIKSMNLPDAIINPVNVVIKMLAAMIAAYVATRHLQLYTWAYGALAGVLYTVAGFLMLSLLDGAFGLLAMLMGDMVMGAIVGFAAGIVVQMMPAKKTVKR